MDRVNPPTQVGFILRPDAVSVEKLPLISELGVFGIYVRCVCLCVVLVRGEEIHNNTSYLGDVYWTWKIMWFSTLLFGYLHTIRKGQQVLLNQEGGYILRTKPVNVNEGGVAAGAGSLDSPILIPDADFIKDVCTAWLSSNTLFTAYNTGAALLLSLYL